MGSSKKSKPAQESAAAEPAVEPVADAAVAEHPAEAVEEPQPEVAEAEQPVEAEAQPEAELAEPADEAPNDDDVELLNINAALRPMVAADGSDASCDLYKRSKAGHVLVPGSEVSAMLEHGFVLVDDEA